MNEVNIILLKDIHLPDGYTYNAYDVYFDISKFTDLLNNTCYEPVKGHVITNINNNVMELGVTTAEIFRRLEKIGKIEDIEYILENILKIEELEAKVNTLENSIDSLTEQINELKAREED